MAPVAPGAPVRAPSRPSTGASAGRRAAFPKLRPLLTHTHQRCAAGCRDVPRPSETCALEDEEWARRRRAGRAQRLLGRRGTVGGCRPPWSRRRRAAAERSQTRPAVAGASSAVCSWATGDGGPWRGRSAVESARRVGSRRGQQPSHSGQRLRRGRRCGQAMSLSTRVQARCRSRIRGATLDAVVSGSRAGQSRCGRGLGGLS